MKNINFYGFNFENMGPEELEQIFKRIQEEIESDKKFNGEYPRKVHVYKSWTEMMNSKHPETHCTITI